MGRVYSKTSMYSLFLQHRGTSRMNSTEPVWNEDESNDKVTRSKRGDLVVLNLLCPLKYFVNNIQNMDRNDTNKRIDVSSHQRMGSLASSLKRLHTHAARHKSCSNKYEKIFSTTSSGSFSCKYCSAGAAGERTAVEWENQITHGSLKWDCRFTGSYTETSTTTVKFPAWFNI